MAIFRRPGFESRVVAHHGCKVAVVQEIEHFFALFRAHRRILERTDCGELVTLGLRHAGLVLDPAGADHEDVAVLESDTLFFGDCLDVRDGEFLNRVRIVGLCFPGPVVNQDTSQAGKARLGLLVQLQVSLSVVVVDVMSSTLY